MVQSLAEVIQDIFHILDADREPDQVGGYSGFTELLIRELPVGVAGRMEDTGTGISHMGDDADQSEGIHKPDGGLTVALQTEGQYAA